MTDAPTAAFAAQCPYTSSTCPLLAPFSLNLNSAPSPSACASAHSSPAPAIVAPDGAASNRNHGSSDLRTSATDGGYSAHPSGQLMLSSGEPYTDSTTSPTVPIHQRSALAQPVASGRDSPSCQPGQCSTPAICNPPAPSSDAGYQHHDQRAYADAQRPDMQRNYSSSSRPTTTSTVSSQSPEYAVMKEQPTPANNIMQSPRIQPVLLQRPIFGQPSPGQQYQGDLSLPSPNTLFHVPPSYEDDRRTLSYPSSSAYPYPPQPPQQQAPRLPSYGSFGTCDVEDLIGAPHPNAYVDRKPDISRQSSGYSTAPSYSSLPPPPPVSFPGPAPPPQAAQPPPPVDASAVGNSSSGEQTAFISKLWHLLTHPEYERYLRWNAAGDAFILTNANEFAINCLPRFFRHSNVASFIRQLNLYSFSRVSTIRLLDMADTSTSTAIIPPNQVSEPHSLHAHAPDHAHHHHHHGDSDSDAGSSHSGEGDGHGAHGARPEASIAASGFSHPNFLRGRPDLLKLLKPRGSSKKSTAAKKAAMAVNAEKAKNSPIGSSSAAHRKK